MQILAAAYERLSMNGDLDSKSGMGMNDDVEFENDMADEKEVEEFSMSSRRIARLERDRKDLLELLMAVWQNVPAARGYMQPLSNFAQASRETTGLSEEVLEFSAEGRTTSYFFVFFLFFIVAVLTLNWSQDDEVVI